MSIHAASLSERKVLCMDETPPPQVPPFVEYAGFHPPPGGEGKATASLILGILGVFMWLCPIVGLVVGIVGLVLGIQANKQHRRKSATAGIVLSIICLVLTLANGGMGCYLGATGQHPLMNWLRQQGGSGT